MTSNKAFAPILSFLICLAVILPCAAANLKGLELEAMDYRCNKYSPREKIDFIKKYSKAGFAPPTSEESAWLRCFCFLHQSGFVEAQKEARRIVAKNPELASPHLFLAVMQMHSFEDSSALGEIGEALKLRPNFFNAYWIRSNIYLSTGELKLALADLDRAYALCHSDLIRLILTERADLEFRSKNYDAAIRDARMAIAKYVQPLSHNYDLIMHCYVEKKNWTEVIKVANQCENLFPASKYYKFARAKAYFSLAKYPEALRDVQKFMEKAGDARVLGEQKEAIALRADIYEKLGKKGMAEADRQALKRDEDSIYKDTIFMNRK